MRRLGPVPGHSLPALPGTAPGPTRTAPHAAPRSRPARAGPGARPAAGPVRGRCPRPGVGHAARRGDLPGLGVDHVPLVESPRRDQRAPPPGRSPTPHHPRAGGRGAQPGVVLRRDQAQGPSPGRALRPVHDGRHLQPLLPGLDGRRPGGRPAGQGLDRRGGRLPAHRAGHAHHPRRPGQLDDLQARRSPAGGPDDRPHPFPSSRI